MLGRLRLHELQRHHALRPHVHSQLLKVLLLQQLVLGAEGVNVFGARHVFEKLIVLRATEVVLWRGVRHQLHLVVVGHVLLGRRADARV